jgi:hypothetical protein
MSYISEENNTGLMKQVEALIIGAGRSGTTSMYKYLEGHPEICMSYIKEIHFFSFDDLYARGDKYYHSFFKGSDQQKKIGVDTYLLIDKKGPERVKQYNPDMKIIVLLRDPIERAYSGYQYALNNGYLKKSISFQQAAQNEGYHIENSDIIKCNNLCNIYQSMYYEHISYWMEFFPSENFLFLRTSDLRSDINTLFDKLSDFLNIKEFKNKDAQITVNKASESKSKLLQQFLLDRSNPLRVFLRRILPKAIKTKILKSNITEKLSSFNRKDVTYAPISGEDYRTAESYLEHDMKLLREIYKIDF